MAKGFFLESLLTAIESIKANKLRSILTTLGVIIGVMTVITVVSLIYGLQNKVSRTFTSLGTDVLYIQKFPWIMGGRQKVWEILKRKPITLKEYDALKKARNIEYIAPLFENPADLRYRDREMYGVTIVGTIPEYEKITQHRAEIGRYIVDDDVVYRRNVAVIGRDVVSSLFREENPIGKSIRIGPHRFRVVGILEEKGAFFGTSMDNVIVVPYTVFEKYFSRRRARFASLTIVVKAKDKNKAIEEIRWLLRRVRRVPEDKPDDFSINTPEALLSKWNELTRTIYLVMIGIASFALVVGGIGIMNIMLVSVAERTREIGLRKALGAKNQEIMWQFLIESILISLVGGAIGIGSGFLLAWLISTIANMPFGVPVWSVVLGLLFSIATGGFFGIYPARKASELNPVEALRYE